MAEDVRILMVGLSDSGKTTYLAALWELVRAKPSVAGALRLVEDPPERDYFHEINRVWLQLERMVHSNADRPRHAALSLQTPDEIRFQLEIPDISGEDFNQAWEGEPWPEEISEIASKANAVMLFARRDQVVPPLLLPPDDAEIPEARAGSEWSAKNAPTQTKLADLLETLDSLTEGPLPTALVASAWDATDEEEEIRPDQWLKRRLPLLWQMLESRADTRPYSVFGISAQGGDFDDREEKERLAAVDPPHERIKVIHGKKSSSDISAPISWLFEQVK